MRFVNYFGALFMEKKDNAWRISTGRISWWIVFSLAIRVWASGPQLGDTDIAENHFALLMVLAGYNFGKHAITKAKEIWGKNEGPG